VLKKINEYLHHIEIYSKRTPLAEEPSRLNGLLYAANPVYLDVYQGDSFYLKKPIIMIMMIMLIASLMFFGGAFALMYVAVEDFGLWSMGGGAFLGAAILTAFVFWRFIQEDARYMAVFFWTIVVGMSCLMFLMLVLDFDDTKGSIDQWFAYYMMIVIALVMAVYMGLFALSSVRILTTPQANIARFDRKRQKVFVMVEPLPVRFGDITLKHLLHYQSVVLEIPWKNLYPAIRRHSMLVWGREFQAMFVEPKPGEWDGTEQTLCTTSGAMHMVKIGHGGSTGMTGTEPEYGEAEALEAIRRYMEEDYTPEIRPLQWRNFYRPSWQAILGVYSSVEEWALDSNILFNPLALNVLNIIYWFLEICLDVIRLFLLSGVLVYGGIFSSIYNWIAMSRAPYPEFPENIRKMHEADLKALQMDAYGNPLDANGNPILPEPPPVAAPSPRLKDFEHSDKVYPLPPPGANLSPATRKKLLLLDKVLAYIAFFFAALSPLLWFIILMPGFPNIFGDYELFSPYFSAAIAVCLARLSLPLARQIKPEGVWRPAVPSQETQPTAPPTLDDYLPEIVVHLKSEFRRIWFTYRKKQPSPKANPTDNAPPPQ
jgi:hypothetical protein